MNQTIDGAMAYAWEYDIKADADGGFRLTVIPRLVDFEIFADTREELEAEWKDALRSHLQAYVATGKCIPIPSVRVRQDQSSTHGADLPVVVKIEDGELQAA